MAAPAPDAFELGGHGEQQGFAARRGHQLDRSRQASGRAGTARWRPGSLAMFHTPVIGANLSAATTLRSQDRSPQRRAGGHGQASDGMTRTSWRSKNGSNAARSRSRSPSPGGRTRRTSWPARTCRRVRRSRPEPARYGAASPTGLANQDAISAGVAHSG